MFPENGTIYMAHVLMLVHVGFAKYVTWPAKTDYLSEDRKMPIFVIFAQS